MTEYLTIILFLGFSVADEVIVKRVKGEQETTDIENGSSTPPPLVQSMVVNINEGLLT